jgi:DNA-binding NtrC family response regulator
MRDRTGTSHSTRPPLTPPSPEATASGLTHAEALYRTGRTHELLETIGPLRGHGASQQTHVRVNLLEGMAMFDVGNVVQSLRLLAAAVEGSRRLDESLHFAAALALFLRESDFQSPDEVLPGLASLRQLASRIGDANALAGLHLGVARLEGLRGHCAGAHRHLEIARRFAERSRDVSLQCCVDNVDASLETIAGSFGRSRQLAQSCFTRADAAGFVKYTIGALANLAVVDLYTGDLPAAQERLQRVLKQAAGLTYVQLGALDSLACIALREGRLEACAELLARCRAVVATDAVPAPSWNDLAHRVTECGYLEHRGEWAAIVDTVDGVDGELQRRQYQALRTSLLCAKARAFARRQQPVEAQAALATAMRTCPRGAVDPAIVLEASKAVCLGVRGEWHAADGHFDRAIAACRAINHAYHHWWIDRDRQSLSRTRRGGADRPGRRRDLTDTATLLSEVAGIVTNAPSMDLLVHAVVSILESTPLGPRLRVERERVGDGVPDSGVTWNFDPSGTCQIEARRGDDRAVIRCDGVNSLEEISLLKSLSDLMQPAVRQLGLADAFEDELSLWPGGWSATGDDTVFRSPRMLEVLQVTERLATTTMPILITGETGTGKELLAKFIHERSKVAREIFMPFNCAAIPRELVESQLFGHRRGAFTGAVDASAGVIRSAARGTLFLDEVGELEPVIQPKLLRFLESGEIHPVGELRPQRVTVRVVAATNTDLEQLADAGRFRRDLFYRLGAARVTLPPLRERKDEIPALATLFLARYAKECRRSGLRIGDDFIAALLLYNWPGNIRQLSNEIRRVVALASDGQTLTAGDLAPNVASAWEARPIAVPESSAPRVEVRLDQPLAHAVAELERKFIEHALSTSGGRVADAAQLLGVSRKGLFLKRRRQGFLSS